MIKLGKIVKEIMDAPPTNNIQQHQSISQTNVVDEKRLIKAYILAATLWGEARGEGERGMQAVLNVIMNRAKGDFDKASELVLKPKQFSFWNKISNPQEYSKALAKSQRNKNTADSTTYNKALELVDKAMKHQLDDITGGAKFYFNPKIVTPSWSKNMVKTATIGHHDFYKIKSTK